MEDGDHHFVPRPIANVALSNAEKILAKNKQNGSDKPQHHERVALGKLLANCRGYENVTTVPNNDGTCHLSVGPQKINVSAMTVDDLDRFLRVELPQKNWGAFVPTAAFEALTRATAACIANAKANQLQLAHETRNEVITLAAASE